MTNRFLCAVAVALCTLISGAALAQGRAGNTAPVGGQEGGPKGAPPAPSVVPMTWEFQASANLAKDYPGATETWHHGVGYITPYGAAEYYCGKGFPEQKTKQLNDWQKGMFEKLTGRADALFCIYKVAQGTMYVWDSVAGSFSMFADGGTRNENVNLIDGGTGIFANATGFMIGPTEGGGDPVPLANGRRGMQALMKIMNGYVNLGENKPVQ